MATAATSLLGLALPVTGELQGTWGDTVNNSITSLLDTAVAGTTTLSTDGDVTLTTTTLASNQARQAILLCSGARTALRTITAPAQSKIYTIINATTGGFSVKLVGVGPTTGLTIPNGASAVVAWNGSDFIEIGSSTIGNLTVNGNLTVTGTSTLTGAATLTANPTLSAGTANGVAYLNGSKVVTTGSALTFDGTNLGVANGSVTAGNTGVVLNGKYSSGFPTSGAGYFQLQTNNVDGTTGGLSVFTNSAGTLRQSYRIQEDIPSTNSYQSWNVNGSEQMRLTSTGLGIGTSSPSYKLDVQGTEARVRDSGNVNFAALNIFTGVSLGGNGAGTRGIQTTSADALTFGTNSTERMRLDSSGNLGLGVTPSAWSTLKGFQFAGGAVSGYAGGGSNNQVHLLNNAYYGSGGWTYITSDTAQRYTTVNGQHQWYNAPSGTAGNAITFTQAMTLDASGNLGIGTTSPKANTGYATFTLNNATNGGVVQYCQNDTTIGQLFFDGNGGTLRTVSNTAMVFGTNNTERARIDSSGNLIGAGTTSVIYWTGVYNNTTATAANMVVNSNGSFARSTSALKYKRDVRDLENVNVDLLRPVRYKSNCENDDQTKDHFGLIADEVDAAGIKELVNYGADGEVEGFQYERLTVVLLKEIQSLRKRVAQLEGK